MQSAFPKVGGTCPGTSQSVNRGSKRRVDSSPHRNVPVILIKGAELLRLSMYLSPNSPVEGVTHIANLLSYQHIRGFSLEVHIRRGQVGSVALGAFRGFYSYEQLKVPVSIRVDVMVLLDEKNVTVESPGLLHPIPHSVHHPPPVVLQRHDPRRPVVAVLVSRPVALLRSGVVLVVAIAQGDAREAVGEQVRRVGRKNLLHLAEPDAPDDAVHLGEVSVVAHDQQRLADALHAGEAPDDRPEVPGAVVDVKDNLCMVLGQGGEEIRVPGGQSVSLIQGDREEGLLRQLELETRIR